MRICRQCGQVVAETINSCPACGADVANGQATIDDYRILEVLHEGHSSILFKAYRDGDAAPVMIRIFTPQSGVDAQLADRLKHELEKLKTLPDAFFVRHLAIRQAADGRWYRISEWIDALSWGTLLSTDRLKDSRSVLHLFGQIASILDGLHRIGHIMPHLILDDILVVEDEDRTLKVKIDYKLSRFLDPQLDRPAPMLARLLAMHPDIVNHRPLDHHSDIWSLGKAFVEILCADPDVQHLQARVESLPVSSAVQNLIRLMFSDNPELRPRTMGEVAATLAQVDETAIRAVARRQTTDNRRTSQALLHRVNLRLGVMAVLLIVGIVAGGLLWINLNPSPEDSETALITYANKYAGSVAFIVVDYWLTLEGRKVYRNRTKGTAFLVDDQGFLLTNRHVACPWLEDRQLMMAIGLFGGQPEKLNFNYRMYLWFEGQRAFSHLPVLGDSDSLEDVYITESAFSTHGPRRVRVAGVASAPETTWERVRSPLRDDFAVLAIDPVPPTLRPLPLATNFQTGGIPKLTPLITLGFPLGGRTQAETVNVSVTLGHVRRTFENMFQVDTSLHAGNSGGPFIDQNGQVVGLATIVAVTMAQSPVPVATPLSDIGLVLPISQVIEFLNEIKKGKVKWNGEIDVALDQRLHRITEVARRCEWDKALDLSNQALNVHRTPSLAMSTAVMHVCSGRFDMARQLLDQVLSMEPERNMARLIFLIVDWLQRRELNRTSWHALVSLDWRSSDEFLGYLAKIMAGTVDAREAIRGGYTLTEKSWLHLVAGLVEQRGGNRDVAWRLMEEAALSADIDDWSLYLALSQLDQVQRRPTGGTDDASLCREYETRFEAFRERLIASVTARQELRTKRANLAKAFHDQQADLKAQRRLLKELFESDSENGRLLIAQAYYAAMDEDWVAALDFCRRFLILPGRTNDGKLSMGLLEPEILNIQGYAMLARGGLNVYGQRISDPWYQDLSACLLDPQRQAQIMSKIDESPENVLTGHTALGLWAEGNGDLSGAIRNYKEALASYMDYRIEYDFALGRFKRLRQVVEGQ